LEKRRLDVGERGGEDSDPGCVCFQDGKELERRAGNTTTGKREEGGKERAVDRARQTAQLDGPEEEMTYRDAAVDSGGSGCQVEVWKRMELKASLRSVGSASRCWNEKGVELDRQERTEGRRHPERWMT
jgi:hypothetical protein